MKRMIKALLLASVLGGVLSGCGDSAELRMRNANLALKNGKPDQALQLAEGVLEEKPGDAEATKIKARAQMQLLRLDDALKTIDHLAQANPDLVEARRLKAQWAMVKLGTLFSQSDFNTNPKSQEVFDQTLRLGREQADWMETTGKSKGDAGFYRARLAEAEAMRVQRSIRDKERDLKEGDADAQQVVNNDLRRLREQYDALMTSARDQLKSAVDADPRHFDAAGMYARLLLDRQDWPAIWALAQKVSREKDLPAGLYEQLAYALVAMPTSEQTPAARVELGWKIRDALAETQKNTSPTRISTAKLHLLAGEADKAMPFLDAALKSKPKDVTARYLKAQALYEQAKFEEARNVLAKLSTDAANSPQIQVLYAMALWKTNNMSQAKEAIQKAIDIDRRNSPTLTENPRYIEIKVAIISAEGKFSEAGDEIGRNYDNNPTDPRAIRFKVTFDQTQGHPDRVREVLERTEKISPLEDEHLVILVDGYAFLSNFEKAEQYAQMLVQRHPDVPAGQLKLAEMRLMQNKDAQVRAMLKELKAKYPKYANIDQLMGRLYLQRGSFDRAVESLRSVVDAEPTNLEARMLLARAYTSLFLMEDALEQIGKVLEKDPGNVDAHAIAARIYQVLDQPDKANEHLSQIDEKKVTEASNPALLAQIKARLGDLDEAAAICNRALASGNTDASLRLILADIYLRKQDYPHAEENLVALVRAQPNLPLGYSLLTNFYLERKDYDAGRTQFIKFQSLPDMAEPLSRLAQARLLMAANRPDEALQIVQPGYEAQVRARKPLALPLGDAVAKIHLMRNDIPAAVAVYDKLKDAKFLAAQASLRQADIMRSRESKDQAVKRLEAIAKMISPDQSRMRYEVMDRFAQLQRYESALALLDDWIAQKPDEALLHRWRGDALIPLGRVDDAIASYKTAIKLAPDAVEMPARLGQAYQAKFDFPAAEQVYLDMAKQVTAFKIAGLSALGQMYLKLGLKEQAVGAFEAIEAGGKVNDPRVFYAAGTAYASLGRDAAAAEKLSSIPAYSTLYVPAQVALSRLEQRQGKADEARKRLQDIARNPKFAGAVASELMQLNLRNASSDELAKWSDEQLAIERLPEASRARWLMVRTAIAADRKDWKATLAALDDLERLQPKTTQVAILRACVLIRLGRIPEAARVLANDPALSKGSLLSLVVGQPAPPESLKAPLAAYIAGAIHGDIPAARSAAEKVLGLRTIYSTDLLPVLERPDIQTPEMNAAFKQFALALVAQEAGLPQLTEELCREVMKKMPSFAPAYALAAQALIDMNKSVGPFVDQTARAIPTSSLAIFLAARERALEKDNKGAAEIMQKLVDREPKNDFLLYTQASFLQIANDPEGAMPKLEAVRAMNGAYKVAASNDLAYLLAENRPAELGRARSMANEMLKLQPDYSPLIDTVGWIEHLSKNDAAAIPLLSRAVVALGGIPEVQYHMGATYKSVGNEKWAGYHLTAAAAGPADSPATERAKALLKR